MVKKGGGGLVGVWVEGRFVVDMKMEERKMGTAKGERAEVKKMEGCRANGKKD